MAANEQLGGGPARKLGRGISALLGAPVQIQVPRVAPAAQPVAPATPQLAGASEAPHRSKDRSSESPTKGAAGPSVSGSSLQVGLREIPVEQILPNRRQPRADFDEAALASLAASIRQAGLMQPIMVRPTSRGFELVAGERRWRAAKLLGMATIPALVREIDDATSAELALIENIQREDLNPMERAHALRRLAADFGLTHQQIADKVGLDRASVTNLLRLSELDTTTGDLVRAGKLSQGHAKALLGVADLGLRADLAARAVAGDWSVRELERQVQQSQRGNIQQKSTESAQTAEPSARDANVADLERQLSEHLGTRVTLHLGRKKGSGRLVCDFYSLDQFDGLMQRMGFGSRR